MFIKVGMTVGELFDKGLKSHSLFPLATKTIYSLIYRHST
jgi:hypothetical protein